MLDTIYQRQKKDWRLFVKPLAHAYNCTVNETTGFSSYYYLVFGNHTRLPINIVFGTGPDVYHEKSRSWYVYDLKVRLKYAYDIAWADTKKYFNRKPEAL